MDLEKEVGIVDIIADEFTTLISDLYMSPFSVSSSFSETGQRADIKHDSWAIEVTARNEWAHSNPEPTSNRVGRLVINHEVVKVGRLGTLYTIALAEPQLEREVFIVLHEEVTRYIISQAEVMERNCQLCRSDVLQNDIDMCWKAVEFFDLRYLAHMYRSKYLGWTKIPDYVIVGSERDDGSPPVDRRPYRKEQITNEMHDPSRWEGD